MLLVDRRFVVKGKKGFLTQGRCTPNINQKKIFFKAEKKKFRCTPFRLSTNWDLDLRVRCQVGYM
jgi:hypothetical protein